MNQVRLIAADNTVVVSWLDDYTRAATLDAAGAATSRAVTDRAAVIGVDDTIGSSPTVHLVVIGGGKFPLTGRRRAADNIPFGEALVFDEAGASSAPAVAFDGQRFTVAWSRPTADPERWDIQVATVGERTGEPAPVVLVQSRSLPSPSIHLVPVDGVTWVLWNGNPTSEDNSWDEERLLGMRLGRDGALLDAAPVELGAAHRLVATGSLGDVALVITASDGSLGAQALDANGLTMGRSSSLSSLAISGVIAVTPSPARDGYILWSGDDYRGDLAFPRQLATTTGYRLDRAGAPLAAPVFAAFPGAQVSVVAVGDGFRYAAVEESAVDTFSRLRTGAITAAGATSAAAPIVDNEVERVVETVCVEGIGEGCAAAGAGTGAAAVLIAGLAVALPRRRRRR